MDENLYKFLKWTAIGLTALWVGWAAYDSFVLQKDPGDRPYLEGNTLFEDGYYERALEKYDEALTQDPRHIHAMRGRARTLMQLGRFSEALQAFDEVVELRPEFGASYANRGILHDRMGRYRKAIADYERALELDPELAEGPHWLIRFLRNQPEKPPGIDDRAAYLRAQLALPEDERVLRKPEIDAQQRPYKQ